MNDETREEWLQGHQDGRVYPLGQALRRTWDAENHDSLGSDVTGLMIDLSKVPYEPAAVQPAAAAVPVPAPVLPEASEARPSMLARLGGLIGWR